MLTIAHVAKLSLGIQMPSVGTIIDLIIDFKVPGRSSTVVDGQGTVRA